MSSMLKYVVAVAFLVVVASTDDHKRAPLKKEGDALSSHDHGEGADHNAEYDHEAFLGKDEAEEYVLLTPEESKKKLGELYSKVDSEETLDGFVTREELRKWIQGQQIRYRGREAERKVNETDEDGDGEISWGEFENATYGFLLDDDAEDEDNKAHYLEMKDRDSRRFKVADVNGDGKLAGDEVGAFINPEYDEHMHGSVFEETMEYFDKDQDGFVSFKEFMDDVTSEDGKAGDTKEEEWVANERREFNEVRDKNKDGKLDAAEIKMWVLPNVAESIERETDHLMAEADLNKDGKLTKEEMLEKYYVFVGSSPPSSYNYIKHDEL